ncbi:MAG: T9SS type A sorting domain-containing protein [Bacteroidales bacterium]|nr:T9SS type A sorting domain-containing protein [Bacteroidales bacterium]
MVNKVILKSILVILFLILLSIVSGYAQCNSTYNLFTYTISETTTTVDITFSINEPVSSSDGYCWRDFSWDFGDYNTLEVRKNLGDSYYSESHSYSKTDPDIYFNGQFNISVDLNIVYWFQATYDCSPLECYEYERSITFTSSNGFILDFTTDPSGGVFNVGDDIDFNYEITVADPPSFGSAYYNFSLTVPGYTYSEVNTISASDLNINNTIKTLTPDTFGNFTSTFELYRDGSLVDSRSLNLYVTGQPTTPGSCQYYGERPVIGLSYTINEDGYVVFTITDESSPQFKSTYGGCCRYKLEVHYPVNMTKCISPVDPYCDEVKYWHTYYSSGGFGTYTWDELKQPGVLQNPIKDYFHLELSSNISTTKNYTIYPKEFDPSENEREIDPRGDTVTIYTYTSACQHTIMQNINDLSDELDWIINDEITFDLYGNNLIAFRAKGNYSDFDRDLTIKLYVDGNYDKCLSVINGEKMNYRLINVHQPTMLMNMSSDTISKILLPSNTIPKEIRDQAAYFSISDGDAAHDKSIAYFRTDEYLPLDQIYEICDGSMICSIKLWAYDDNNEPIWSQEYTIYNCRCNDPFVYLFDTDITIINRTGTYVVASYLSAKANKMLAIFAETAVELGPGFYTEDNAYFIADTRPCTYMADNLNDEASKTIIPYRINDTIKSGEILDIYPKVTNNGIKIYPNPNKGDFTVELSDCSKDIVKIEILKISGSIVFQKTDRLTGSLQINLSNCSEGVYILRSYTEIGEMFFNMIIIQ